MELIIQDFIEYLKSRQVSKNTLVSYERDINQLVSQYGNDELAMQAILKLSLDPSMADASLETWKSKIEDKNPNKKKPTKSPYPFVGKVTASKLNVRKKAGTGQPLLPTYPQLNKDDLVDVLGETKDSQGTKWYKVSIAKKYAGYVSAKYITKA